MKKSPEHILVDGLKEGNRKIFDYLFHHYYSGLVAFAHNYLHDMETSEDIVQEFFFQLWLNRNKLSIRQSIKNYFFTSVKNRCLDLLKHQKIGTRIQNELIYLWNEPVDEHDFVVESEFENHLNNALDKLPEKCRKVFLMNRFEGMKPIEIAKKEDISVRTVEGHIGKAIKMLRSELKAHLPSFLIIFLLKEKNQMANR